MWPPLKEPDPRSMWKRTGSPRGKEILDNFSEYLPKFKKVHAPTTMTGCSGVIASDGGAAAWTRDQAQIEAFYAVQKK